MVTTTRRATVGRRTTRHQTSKTEATQLTARRSEIIAEILATQPEFDTKKWALEVKAMRARAKLKSPAPRRPWTREDLYEDRLSRYAR